MSIHQPSEKTKTKKPKSSIISRRINKKSPLWERNPLLARKISHMRLAIAPIVHVRTGIAPKEYPANMLSLFLLTEKQLDNMAEYYSQIEESGLTNQYPHRMAWDKPFLCNAPELPENCRLSDLERLKVKQRMFARFIGIRGAETPGWEYERQVEILRNKIRHSILEEENTLRKMFQGPGRSF